MSKQNEKQSEELFSGTEPSSPGRGHVRHLGFVVNPSDQVPAGLSHLLINLQEQPDKWYVLEPGARGPRKQPQVEKGLRRYVGTLFFLAIRAIRQFDRNRQLALGDVILSDAEVAHSHVASYLRGVNRADKLNSVSPAFPALRLAIANSVFAPSGAQPPLAIHWNADDIPNSIFFFWKPEELAERFPNALRQGADHQRLRTVAATAIAPTTQALTPNSLTFLAEDILAERSGYDWQTLYRRALIINAQNDDFITLSAQEAVAGPAGTDASPRRSGDGAYSRKSASDALDLLCDKNRVLLTGPAGSGKSTVLRHIAANFASRVTLALTEAPLPLYIRLKLFEQHDQTLSEIAGKSVREMLHNHLSTEALHQYQKARKRNDSKEPLTHAQILNMIEADVCRFLDHRASNGSGIVFLLDGYNEVQPELVNTLASQIRRYVAAEGALIATRNVPQVPPLQAMLHYSLKPLSGTEIKTFLRERLGAKTLNRIQNWLLMPSIKRMLQYPFYLTRAIALVTQTAGTAMPFARGQLITRFIEEALQRKSAEGYALPYELRPVFARTLATEAWEQINKWLGNDHALPRQFSTSSHSTASERAALLSLAQAIGILESPTRGAISSAQSERFTHDLYRDYFAAAQLHQFSPNALQRVLPELAEHYALDSCLELLSGMIDEPAQASALLNALGGIDLFLCLRCLSECQVVGDEQITRVVTTVCDSGVGGWPDIDIAMGYCISKLPSPSIVSIYDKTKERCSRALQEVLLTSLVEKDGDCALATLAPRLTRDDPDPTICEAIGRLESTQAFDVLLDTARSNPDDDFFVLSALRASRAKIPVARLVALAKNSHIAEALLDRFYHLYYETPDEIEALIKHPNALIARSARDIVETLILKSDSSVSYSEVSRAILLRTHCVDDIIETLHTRAVMHMHHPAQLTLLELIKQSLEIWPPKDVLFHLKLCIGVLSEFGPIDVCDRLAELACFGQGSLAPEILWRIWPSSTGFRREVFREIRANSRDSLARRRATLALGLLGETEVIPEILKMVSRLPMIQWCRKVPKSKYLTTAEHSAIQRETKERFADLVHRAVLALRATSAIPILEKQFGAAIAKQGRVFYANAPHTHFLLRCQLADSVDALVGLVDELFGSERVQRWFAGKLSVRENFLHKAIEEIARRAMQVDGKDKALLAERLWSHLGEHHDLFGHSMNNPDVVIAISAFKEITGRRWLQQFGLTPVPVAF